MRFSGSKVLIRVTAEPAAVARKGPGNVDVAKDPDRKAAEYVLSIGGKVEIDNPIGEVRRPR